MTADSVRKSFRMSEGSALHSTIGASAGCSQGFSSNVLLSSVSPGSLILSGLLPLIHIIPLIARAKHVELYRYIRL